MYTHVSFGTQGAHIPSDVYSLDEFDFEYALCSEISKEKSSLFLQICHLLTWPEVEKNLEHAYLLPVETDINNLCTTPTSHTNYGKKKQESFFKRAIKSDNGRLLLSNCKNRILHELKKCFKFHDDNKKYHMSNDFVEKFLFVDHNYPTCDEDYVSDDECLGSGEKITDWFGGL